MSIQALSRWIEISDGVTTVSISVYEALSYSQSYEVVGGRAFFRTLDGTGVKQQNWTRLTTSVSGDGGLPLGFSGLDFSSTLTMKCGAVRAISAPTNVIVIPASRRSDAGYEPYGHKRIDGFLVSAPVSEAGNTITVEVDGAADAYQVSYYPQLTVHMDDPSESNDIHEASTGWTFTAEEI